MAKEKKSKKVCMICNKDNYVKGYCRKHYLQIYMHGKILKRTIYDPNKFIEQNNNFIIITYDKKGNENGQIIIDKEDKEFLSKYKWCIANGYPQTMINRKPKKMHQLLIEKNNGKVCDHINRNRLDNRKGNLRLVSPTINNLNKKTKNISYHKQLGYWRIYCTRNGKYLYHNYTKSLKEAQKLKEELERKHLKNIRYGI